MRNQARSTRNYISTAINLLGTTCIFLSTMGFASSATRSITIEESRLWRENPLLMQIAKKLNPLSMPPGDGALGLNRRFPEKVLVEFQLEGWNWIRSGAALGNGFVADRGVMAFEWAFARMSEGDAGKPELGSFGESKTIEVTNFLGLYARSIALLHGANLEERAKRLERLAPRLETSLRSARSLKGERRWDAAERKSPETHQRIQAAAAAYWIGRLLINPTLRKTADLWLDEALKRQDGTGYFPTSLPMKSKAAARAQGEALDALQGLAWADAGYALKLKEPISRGFRWLEMTKPPLGGSPIPFATYAAQTKNSFALKVAQTAMKSRDTAKP